MEGFYFFMEGVDKRLKMAIIAGAANAVKFKDKNPRATEDQVIRHISENAEEILDKIDNPF
jgi:hypothetical protein